MRRLIGILILVLFTGAASYSQVGFSIGPSVGVTIPSSDYSGSTVDYYNGAKYGMGSGVNFGVLFKARLPVLNIRVAINYSSLSNSGNSEADRPQSFIEAKQNLLIISAGPEFVFKIPSSSLAPYAGVDLLFTSFSGETRFSEVSRVDDGTYTMNTSSRLGIGIGAGVDIALGKKFGLDFGLRYNFLNLMGKNFDELPSDERVDSYVNLNDDQDPNYSVDPNKHPINNSRSISVLQFNLGFLFRF